jgi:hypothetical protein
MAKFGLRREDLGMQGIDYGDHLGPRWYRLLVQGEAMPAFHIGPATPGHVGPMADLADSRAAPPPDNHAEPTLSIPIDETSIAGGDPVSNASGPSGGPAADEALNPAGEQAAVSPPPYLVPAPLTETTPVPVVAPSDDGHAGLSSAFLPADSNDAVDLAHGFDPGFSFTQSPLPPPPPDFV